jgi:hypothetical protein
MVQDKVERDGAKQSSRADQDKGIGAGHCQDQVQGSGGWCQRLRVVRVADASNGRRSIEVTAARCVVAARIAD